MGGRRAMVPDDVYGLSGASDPRLDPTGTTIAFPIWSIDRETNEYRANIWFAPVDGSEPPRRFTTGERRDGTPRWSPDGRMLAFTSARKEKEPSQLYVIPVAGGEPTRLTELKEDVNDPVWSPDGTQIVFAARVRDEAYEEEDGRKRAPRRITRLQYKLDNEGWTVDRRTHLFVVSVEGGGEPRRLTEGDFENVSPSWSPDGTRIAFVSMRREDWDTALVEDIFVVSPEGGDPQQLTPGDATYSAPVWSPDGRMLAFRFTPDPYDWPRHTQIGVVDVETRAIRILTKSLDRHCGPYPDLREPAWDGERILFGVEDHGNVHVYAVAADGSSPPELLVGGDQVVRGFDVRNGALVHVATTPTTFPELYVGERHATDLTGAFEPELIEPERFTAMSADGTEVEAWLVRPHGFDESKRYPVILNIHGGPFTQYGNNFFDEFQVQAGAGYAVVYANPRGSSGYSEEWGRAIRGPIADGPGWGTVDFEDLMAAMDEALRRYPFLDPERTAVLGGSYGGYMTSWIVGHTNRFKTAISERAVNNLFSATGSSDFFWAFIGMFGGDAWSHTDAYLKHSPATYAEQIETPLLILHSENDLRCDVEQAEHLFVRMRLLGKEVELVRFTDESHELSRSGSPVHRVMRFELMLDWLARYLRD
jgi:dipeptidyl aminopeptidase/acylaminoacyl peptidase